MPEALVNKKEQSDVANPGGVVASPRVKKGSVCTLLADSPVLWGLHQLSWQLQHIDNPFKQNPGKLDMHFPHVLYRLIWYFAIKRQFLLPDLGSAQKTQEIY